MWILLIVVVSTTFAREAGTRHGASRESEIVLPQGGRAGEGPWRRYPGVEQPTGRTLQISPTLDPRWGWAECLVAAGVAAIPCVAFLALLLMGRWAVRGFMPQ